jgi:hypothetical protein
MNIARYRKFLVAIGAGIATAISFAADGELSLNDAFGIAAAVLGALGVYAVKNDPAA